MGTHISFIYIFRSYMTLIFRGLKPFMFHDFGSTSLKLSQQERLKAIDALESLWKNFNSPLFFPQFSVGFLLLVLGML